MCRGRCIDRLQRFGDRPDLMDWWLHAAPAEVLHVGIAVDGTTRIRASLSGTESRALVIDGPAAVAENPLFSAERDIAEALGSPTLFICR